MIRGIVSAAAVAVALGLAWAAPAQEPDAAAIAKFADQYFQQGIAKGAAPGAVVAVAVGGKVVFTGAYGVTDRDSKRPMDADATAMRAGQVSQLVTALAVMRAADLGRVDLDADVQGLWAADAIKLDTREPVTLRQLLTHTAGVGDRLLGQTLAPGKPVPALGSFLASRPIAMEARPGQVVIESNLGMALAGLALERSSVPQSFADLADALVFRPAGMTHTTFAASQPSALARPYRWDGTTLVPMDDAQPLATPALGMVTTAHDMAALLALLTGGGEPLLSKPSLDRLTTRQFAVMRPMTGESFGLAEATAAGRTAWIRAGGNPGSSAAVALVPELRLGVFVAANASSYYGMEPDSPTAELVRGFANALVRAAWPAVAAAVPEVAPYQPDDAIEYGGTYRDAAIETDTPAKLLSLVSQKRVHVLDDIDVDVNGVHLRKVALDLFQGPNGEYLRFIRPAGEDSTHIAYPTGAYAVTSLWEAHWVQATASGAGFFLLLVGGLVSAAGLIRPAGRLANAIGAVAGFGGAALLGWMVYVLGSASMDLVVTRGLAGVPYPLVVWLPLVAIAPFAVLLGLFGRGLPTSNRLTLAGVTLGWGLLYPVLTAWNLAG